MISENTESWLGAIHDLSLIMAVVPAVAIVAAWVLLRPQRDTSVPDTAGRR